MDPLIPIVIILSIITLGLGGWKIFDLIKASSVSQTPAIKSDVVQLFVGYLPINLVLFGALFDIYNSQYHYSVASITAICGVLINSFLGEKVVSGIANSAAFIGSKANSLLESSIPRLTPSAAPSVPTVGGGFYPNPFNEKWCTLPGFASLENGVAPQGIVMSMTFLMYLFFELVGTGHVTQSIGIGVTTLIILIIQSIQLISSDCLNEYIYGKYWSILLSVLMAAAFAGTSFAIQTKIWGGDVLPSPFSAPTDSTTSGLSMKNGTIPINVGGSFSHSLPVDDQDQFVCEAYKDGELVTSTIVD
jgi:hypothetical protein